MAKAEYTREEVNVLATKLFNNNVDPDKIDAALQAACGINLSRYYFNVLSVGLKQTTELTTLAGGALNTLLVQSLAGALAEATARL